MTVTLRLETRLNIYEQETLKVKSLGQYVTAENKQLVPPPGV